MNVQDESRNLGKLSLFVMRNVRNIPIILLFLVFSNLPLLTGASKDRPANRGELIHQAQDLDKLILICEGFLSPFLEPDRKSFAVLQNRIIAVYGEFRRSYRPGHHHAGIDLQGGFNETVYAIGCGRVFRIFRTSPHKTIIIKHYLPERKFLYSVYTHVEDIRVKTGDWVDENTALARLFNQTELENADFGTPNHLHLEVRKSFADRGRASYASMSMSQLNRFCMDPQIFFKAHLE